MVSVTNKIHTQLKKTHECNFVTFATSPYIKSDFVKLTKTSKFIGNQPVTLTPKTFQKDTEYYITVKLDGVRKLLFQSKFGTAFISSNATFKPITIQNKIQPNTILDGEYIDQKGTKDQDTFFAFDILFYNGIDLRQKPLHTRLKYLKKALNRTTHIGVGIGIKIKMKEHFRGDLCKIFFYFKKKFGDDLIGGVLDGFIFTPNTSYLDKKLSKTTTFLPPLKWKPIQLLSIDFEIKKVIVGGSYFFKLLLQNGRVYSPPNYFGDKYKGIGTVRVSKELYDTYKSGDILEFVFDKKIGEFVFLRDRPDKSKSNYNTVIDSNMNEIVFPTDMRKILCKKLNL